MTIARSVASSTARTTARPSTIGGVVGGASGFDYIGANAVAAYSVVALKTGVTRCFRVRRSSDSTEQDCLTIAEAVTFCGAGTGFVTKLYDQNAGTLDVAQATTTQQPRIVDSGVAESGVKCDGTDDFLATASNLGISGSANRTVCAWVKLAATGTQCFLSFGSNVSNSLFALFSNGGTWWFNGSGADWLTGVSADTNWHHHAVTYNGTNVEWFVDAVSIGSQALSLTTTNSALNLGRRVDNNWFSAATIHSASVYSAVLSGAEITALKNAFTPS